jgi:hypothetical protein
MKDPDLRAEAFADTKYPDKLEKCYDVFDEANNLFHNGKVKTPYIYLTDLQATSFSGCVVKMIDGVKMLLNVNLIDYCYLPNRYEVIEKLIWHELNHCLMLQKGDSSAGKHGHSRGYSDLCNIATKKLGLENHLCRSMRTWTRKAQHERGIFPCDDWPYFLYPEINRERRNIAQRVLEAKLTAIKPQNAVDTSLLKNCIDGIKTLDDTLMNKGIPFRAHQAFKDVCDYLRATGLNLQTESEIWETMLLKGKKIGQVEHPAAILQSITDKIDAEQMEVRKAIDELIGGTA